MASDEKTPIIKPQTFASDRKLSSNEEALRYHSEGRKGKVEVVPTKPCSSQRDLSLAYTPGVAVPCLKIKDNPHDAYKYTSKGNLEVIFSCPDEAELLS